MQRCPPEIWAEIPRCFDEESKENTETLEALTLVLKSLTPTAQSLLFRSVEINAVAQAERLLEIFKQKSHLAKCVKRIIIRSYYGQLWTWLSSSQGRPLLPYIALIPSLTLRMPDEPSFDMNKVQDVVKYFTSVQSLSMMMETFHCRIFQDVRNVLRSFESTLEHLQLEVFGGFDMEFEIEIGEIPRILSAEVLTTYCSPDMFPLLRVFTSNGFATPELTEWLLRSGIANHIHTLTIVPLISTDIKHAAMLLRHGCQALQQLTFDMGEEGWEGISGMIALNIFRSLVLT
jgi:hypothetical protein